MNIGKSIYEELVKMAEPMDCPPELAPVPMVRLSDLKDWLDTLEMEIVATMSGSHLTLIEVLEDE